MRLLLTEAPEGWEGPEIVMGLAGYPWKKKIEQAGHGYQRLVLRLSGETVLDESEGEDDEEDEMHSEDKSRFEQKRHKKLTLEEEDYYEILGLGHLRWKATEKDIKQAHKKLILKYHPDKNVGVSDEIFKKISKAHDVLSDPKSRRAYDSQDKFEERLPSTFEAEEDFYGVFSATFDRFSRWSVKPNVPTLGDDDTPYEKVKEFYNFWFSFKSWRDFSFGDEFDTNEAESREERRWMERQNERERKKKKREESALFLKLTEMAEKYDPRLRRRKEQMDEEKRREKEARAEVLRKKREEVERKEAEKRAKEEEEAKRKAEEAAALKKQKVAENKKLRRTRTKLRSVTSSIEGVKMEDVEFLCMRLSFPRISELVQKMEQGTPTEAKDAFEKELKEENETVRKERAEEQKKKQPTKVVKDSPWTEEELSLLAKAVSRFPGGTTDRWELIAEFIGTRSVKEIISKTKEANRAVTQKSVLCRTENEFEKFAKTKKGESLAKETIEAVEKPVEKPAEKIPTDWTAEEQKQLEQALRKHPTSLGKERWDRIAEDVPTRTKKECIQRFKFLVAQIKEKKK